MSWRLLPAGADAVLVELETLAETLRAAAWLRHLREAGSGPWALVVDVVPGARSVLVTVGPGRGAGAIRAAIARDLPRQVGQAVPGRGTDDRLGFSGADEVVVVPVLYDGPDLAEVARHTRRSVQDVVATHVAADWVVAFMGFSPGFGYLTSGGGQLQVPRRAEPRTRVRPGSVGLAGEFTGIYPRESPGGWQIIGQTDATLWDLDLTPAAVLRPGVRVRFEAVGP